MDLFSSMSKITDNLFLASLGGMTQENFAKHKITCVINATYEAPNLKKKGIESIRVPVDDSEKDNISEFFDVVADKIHEKALAHENVVVHCIAGISRSTTLVLAYLIKYHKMDLKTAFHHVHERRTIVRPNNSFFKQLITYEHKIVGKSSCKMVVTDVGDNIKIEVPDFFIGQYRGFIMLEKMKQQKRNDKLKALKHKKMASETPFTANTAGTSSFGQLCVLTSDEKRPSPSNVPTSTAVQKDIHSTEKEDKQQEDLIRRFVVEKYKEPPGDDLSASDASDHKAKDKK